MILILREEIVCIFILSFLIFYYMVNKTKDKEMLFLKLASSALIHVIFDVLTVITVNHRDVVPDVLNRVLHICFYISGIVFILVFYNYIINLMLEYKHVRILKKAGFVPLVIFIVMLVFLPMEYVEGHGTDYSYGPLAFVGYGLFVSYCAVCLTILLAFGNRLDKRVKRALTPIIMIMFVAILAQALVPELLMTGGNVTLICIGMFVALDNPDKDYEKQALWDFLTGLKNRNCYNKDMARYMQSSRYQHIRRSIGFIVGDLNHLKKVNDNYGHAEGDELIKAAASVLREHLRTAENVYRLGGDEFIAIYLSPNDRTVAAEMEKVEDACKHATGFAVPLSIALGYSSGILDENIQDIVNKADQIMYENKTRMKMAQKEENQYG